jgi:hypothetical protein
MMTGGALSLVLLIAVSAVAPYFLSRGRLREQLVRFDTLSTVVLLGFWHVAATLEIAPGPSAACGLLLAVKIALFGLVLLREVRVDEDIEWSPARAGLLAFLVYLALVPNILQRPTDGDESFYVLSAESIVSDRDLDLRNQYADLGSSITRRLDLQPQFGDPVGPNGELYSRHEPLLSLVLVPGIVLGGLAGAVATIALFAALAVRAWTALLDEEGVTARVQLLLFGFIALVPPFLNYAIRIWPEAPGAFLLAEMLRAARGRRIGRLVALGILLSALKIRFVPIAATLFLVVILSGAVRRRWVFSGLAGVAAVLGVAWVLFPGVFAARLFDPRTVFVPDNFARGLLGALLDGQAGLLFQAPFFLIALAAVLRWRYVGDAARMGCLAALPYLMLLLPRSEWHGGWSPPLRYLVVFTPVFVLLAAVSAQWIVRRSILLAVSGWTAALAARSIASPAGQFRIASGESGLGEHLSRIWGTDFSRFLPSLIRPNEAALWAAVLLVVAAAVVVIRRAPKPGIRVPWGAALISIVIASFAWAGLRPGDVVEFEDSHVRKNGGELYPERWTVARFRFRGGWTVRTGDAVEFRHRGGLVSLEYYSDQPTTIEVDGVDYEVPTGSDYSDLVIVLPETEDGRHAIRCVRGALILDRLTTE